MESGGPDAWPPSPGGSRFQALSDGYTIPGAAILPLRLFLGLTFVYAGIQKLTDPGFFRAGSPTYIGAQILAFSRGSPIAFLLHRMMQQAVAVGVLTIMTEMTVGGLVLLGLFTRPAALVGLSLSLMFFLSASWHTYPYFFVSDIVFVMCWLTIALTGPGPLSLDPLVQPSIMKELQDRFGEPAGGVLRRILAVPLEPRAVSLEEQAVQGVGATTLRVQVNRAEALLTGAATLGLVLLGLHSRTGSASASQKLASSSRPAPPAGPAGSPGAASAGAQHIPAGYTKIGNISQLPVNSAGTVSDPKTGDPVVVVHTGGSQYYAYDAVCTHAGCTVQYDSSSKLLVCPCHGGAFDPTRGAQVVSGPPPSPLSTIEMKIDSGGNIYIV